MTTDAASPLRVPVPNGLALAIVAAVALALAFAVCAPRAHGAIDHATELDPVERALLSEMNNVRAQRGMSRLEPSIALQRAADRHAYYILDHDWFSHGSRDGRSFAVRVREYVRANHLGETLAWSAASESRDLGRAIARRWLRSPSHRAELLNSSYTRVGVARRGGQLGSVHANVFTADFASS